MRYLGVQQVRIGHEDELVNRGEAVTSVMYTSEWKTSRGDPAYKIRMEVLLHKLEVEGYVAPKIMDEDALLANNIYQDLSEETDQIRWDNKKFELIPHCWDVTRIYDAYAKAITQGDENGNFNPLGTLTRAEACQMLYNAMLTSRGTGIGQSHGTGWDFRWTGETIQYGPYAGMPYSS